jgi:hypothetical protein
MTKTTLITNKGVITLSFKGDRDIYENISKILGDNLEITFNQKTTIKYRCVGKSFMPYANKVEILLREEKDD